MNRFYLLTCYGASKVYYAKLNTLEEAIELANLWDNAKVQEKGIHNRYGGPARVVYERYNGQVTIH